MLNENKLNQRMTSLIESGFFGKVGKKVLKEEKLSSEEVENLKRLIDSEISDNVQLAFNIASAYPDIEITLSYKQFRKYKSDEGIMSVYITKKIPEDQVEDLRGTKYLEPYIKNRVQAEIRDFKKEGFDTDAFSGTELTLLSRGQMMLLGGMGFLFDDYSLQFLLKKSPSQLEGYIRGIFEFVKNGGTLKYNDILKYMTEPEWEEYIRIKGGQLSSEEEMRMLWQAAKDDGSSILKDYLTRRANEAMNSNEEVERFEETYLDYLDEELLKKYYEFFGYDYP